MLTPNDKFTGAGKETMNDQKPEANNEARSPASGAAHGSATPRFVCPFCRRQETVSGVLNPEIGEYPQGWHLSCYECKARWFVQIQTPPNR